MTTAPSERERRTQGVARRIRGLMGELQLRGEDMATRLSMSQPTWSRRVNGVRPFSVDEIEQIAETLRVDEAYLYGFTNERGPRWNSTEGLTLYAIRDSNPEPADMQHGPILSVRPALRIVPAPEPKPTPSTPPAPPARRTQTAVVLPFHRPATSRRAGRREATA